MCVCVCVCVLHKYVARTLDLFLRQDLVLSLLGCIHCVDQVELELVVTLLPLPPKYWDSG